MIFRSILPSVTKRYAQQKILNTHPLHLFRIIQNVDDYMHFLPLCNYSKIIRRSPDGRSFDGKLIVGKSPWFSEEYVSRVTVIPETLTIEAESIESQKIDSLKSKWLLREIERPNDETQCDVNFQVEMTVSDPLIIPILDQVLQKVAGRQIEAFEKRCGELPLPVELIKAANILKKH